MRAFIETIDGAEFKSLLGMSLRDMDLQSYEAAYMAIVGFVDRHCADWTARALVANVADLEKTNFECAKWMQQHGMATAEIARLTANRRILQATAEHPAPCARHCESQAYEIELRRLRGDVERLTAELVEARAAQVEQVEQEPVAASIESGKYFDLLANFVTLESEFQRTEIGIHEAAAASLALVRHIDAHCVAQVAQALAAKPAPTEKYRIDSAPYFGPQQIIDDGRSDAEIKADSQAAPFEQFLKESDLYCLNRFMQCCEDSDSGGHDVSKEEMRRLTEIGVVRSCGFGRHEATAFGGWIYAGAWFQETTLPLMTLAESNAAAGAAYRAKIDTVPERSAE